MKLSDYVVQQLMAWGVRHVFLITGGGAMHLNDSFGNTPGISYVCNHHEQAAAMAAEAYSRVSGIPGVLNVTTGPGGINSLNGVFGAWTDSVPMLVISGQVKRETCMSTYGHADLRQLGDQEVDIVRMVKGITKYSVLLSDPLSVAYHLERAWHICQSGRPGPCWLDIPVDVQSAQISPEGLMHYDPSEDSLKWNIDALRETAAEVVQRIRSANRPVVMAGTGVRLANAIPEFESLIRRLRVPVTTAWTHDLIASDDELFCGRPGTIGDRAGNFAVQNSDLVLVLGSRLNIRQVSYNWKSFARNAFKIQVDVDAAELDKPTVRVEMPVHAELKLFLNLVLSELDRQEYSFPSLHAEWLAWCIERKKRYPVVREAQRQAESPLNVYGFIEHLFSELRNDDVVVCGNATACIVPYQAGRLQKGQRLISNSGSASMGYDLPAAIGAALGRGAGKRVVCLAGDGSVQMNIQELQTLRQTKLPVKLFVLNNNGYLSIRQTQRGFFNGRMVGESSQTGVSFPDISKLADAYGLPVMRVRTRAEYTAMKDLLNQPGPAVFDVCLDATQEFEPRLKSRQLPDGTIVSPNLEDMYPFLSPEEMAENMLSEKDEAITERPY